MGLVGTAMTEEFEITKHYAAVLRGHFGWTSCYTSPDGKQVRYCEQGQDKSKVMSGDKIRIAGRQIEKFYAEGKKVT